MKKKNSRQFLKQRQSGGERDWGTHLLQCGRAQLDGDVLELPVPLGAEVADHVRVLVRLSQQLDLTVRETETLGEDPLDRHITVVKHAPAGRGEEGGLRKRLESPGPAGLLPPMQRLPLQPHSPGCPDPPPGGPMAITTLPGGALPVGHHNDPPAPREPMGAPA